MSQPPLTVLVTACGAPGAARLLRSLRENGEREVRLVGTDMSGRAVGRHLCDAFHVVPRGTDPAFADALLEVCRREGVRVVLPESSFDLPGLAPERGRFADEGVSVLISGPETVRRSNDKAETYAALDRIGVRRPAWRRVTGGRALAEAAAELGYPGVDVCMKPVFSSGSRGFRILSAGADRRTALLEARPGDMPAARVEDVREVLGEEGGPELLVMELATGPEHTVDGIADGRRIVLGHAKTREAVRGGLAMFFATVDDPALMDAAERIVAELEIEWFFNIQLVGEHVIEVNPRISTIVYQDDLNLPYLAVKRALGEVTDEELGALAGRVRPTRRALRYFDQVEWDD